MNRQVLRLWLRRVIGHLTTPILVAFLVSCLISGSNFDWIESFLDVCVVAYLGWAMFVLPGAMSSRRIQPKTIWRYGGQGAGMGALFAAFVLLGGEGLAGSFLAATGLVMIGALSAMWYWFCVRWQPTATARLEPTVVKSTAGVI